MATAETAFGGGLNSSSGGELKLYLKWKRNTCHHAGCREKAVLTQVYRFCPPRGGSRVLRKGAVPILWRRQPTIWPYFPKNPH